MLNHLAINLGKSFTQHVARHSKLGFGPYASIFLRSFSTSLVSERRTHLSFVRVPRSIGNIPIPSSLKDRSIRRHKGRSGRNDTGQIVIRHRGGGHAQTYRIVDFVRAPALKQDEEARLMRDKVLHIGYDPCRSGRIALVAGDGSNKMKIITAPHELEVGDVVTASRGKPQSIAKLKPGDAYPLEHLPIGSLVHNVELRPGNGAQLVRAAGTCAQLVLKTDKIARLRLPSKEEKDVPLRCLASLGRVSNIDNKNRVIGKAGRNRWLNRRPKGQTGLNRTHWKKKRV